MNQQSPCEVCEALDRNELILFETDFWKVNLASDQAYLGRSYVTTKRHIGHLRLLSTEEWQNLHEVIKSFEEAAIKAFGANLFNWAALMNNAYKAEDQNPHVHWHVRPRYKEEVIIDKVSFEDPNFAHHYDRAVKREVEPTTLKRIQTKLVEQLG